MTFQVNSDVQRRAARKVLRDSGMPSAEVHRLSYAGLTAAMAERGCGPAYVALCDLWERETGNGGDGSSPAPAPVPADAPAPESVPARPRTTATAAPSAGTVDGAIMAILGGAIDARVDAALASRPAVDMAKVEALVAKAVDGRLPVVYHVHDGPVIREVPGIKHRMFGDVLTVASTGEHCWLPGPAGSGKSTLMVQVGTALGYTMAGADTPYDAPMMIYVQQATQTSFGYLGYQSPSGDPSTLYTAFRRAWEFGGLIIFDDTDRSSEKALATLNMPLANGYCQFPDRLVIKHPKCLIAATANTFGLGGGADYVGAGRLDKATLDRFVFLNVDYDESAERAIATAQSAKHGADWCAYVQRVRSAVKRLALKHLVTPRATFKGLKLLDAGLARSKVEAAVVFAGLDAETVARVKGAL